MREKPAKADLVIARLATRQHGVVSTGQLRAARLSYEGIRRRSVSGRLHRIHRGVYAVGHKNLSFESRGMAAALACGEEAVISHRSAAGLLRILPPHDGPIEVSIAGDGGRERRRDIRVHRSSTLVAGVVSCRNGIALTKPARTLRDLRRTAPQPVFRAAVRRALDLRLIRSTGLSEADLTRSELERLFLRLCRRHRLPKPEVNARVGPYEVDFLWPERRLVVEVDGFRHHGHRAAFESDRGKDANLQSRGFRVLRFTYRQVTEGRDAVQALRALLSPAVLFR